MKWNQGEIPAPVAGHVLITADPPGSADGGKHGDGQVWWPAMKSADYAGNVGVWECEDDFIPRGSGSESWGVWVVVPAPGGGK